MRFVVEGLAGFGLTCAKSLTNLSLLVTGTPKLLLKLALMLPNVSSFAGSASVKLLACSLLDTLGLIQLGSLK